ncbi:MAG: hypothetical protein ACREIV_02965, partial [Planctomycetaceae bacterium]
MMILPAATPLNVLLLPALGCAAMGVALFILVRTLTRALDTRDLEQDDQWRFDVGRINQLRRVSPLYR